MILTSTVAESARKSVLCWLATVDGRGCPNVSPKEVFAPFDDRHLVIANIASPGSVRNIASNPEVCVSFIDIFVQKGHKLRGTARVVRGEETDFEYWAEPLVAMTAGRFRIRSVVVVRVESVDPILAPSYLMYPDETTEAGQVRAAMRTYGVRPDPAPGD